jgi:hypothetical protein
MKNKQTVNLRTTGARLNEIKKLAPQELIDFILKRME